MKELLQIRQATLEDLEAVTYVEAQAFPPKEAASKESFKGRLGVFTESFLVGELNGEIVALIDGCISEERFITDKLYESNAWHSIAAPNMMVFGIAVLPKHQKKGFGTQMMEAFIALGKAHKKVLITLSCKKHMIPFYEQFGYQLDGLSESNHGGATWYDMTLYL